MKTIAKPIIGVPADVKQIDGQPFHAVGDKYLRAVVLAAEATPLVIPAIGALEDPELLLANLDGLMLSGSPSNVHPTRYGLPAVPEAEPYDHERDETTLPLIRAALALEVPLLAICRGFQELNVALGGSLHHRIHELPGRLDHRRPQHDDMDVQYGPRHPVALTPGGRLEALASRSEIMVNSLHWQGLDRLADRLAVEALAADGTVEAVGVKAQPSFALGVQWHPEYKVLDDPVSLRLFAAFGAAARARAARRAATARPAAPSSAFSAG